jgi:hypothetical protein
VRTDERVDLVYSKKRFFPGDLYEDVMAALHATLPPTARITFNWTDGSRSADCWIRLYQTPEDPPANLDALLDDAINVALTRAG